MQVTFSKIELERAQHSEIYLLPLKEQDNTKVCATVELPLGVVIPGVR